MNEKLCTSNFFFFLKKNDCVIRKKMLLVAICKNEGACQTCIYNPVNNLLCKKKKKKERKKERKKEGNKEGRKKEGRKEESKISTPSFSICLIILCKHFSNH
jgi:hypothetical protein